MQIPGWFFRLRDTGLFTVISGAGYLILSVGLLYFALWSTSAAIAAMLFVLAAASALAGSVLIWSVGRVRRQQHLPKDDKH